MTERFGIPGQLVCHTCNRDFKTQILYDQHNSEHVKCSVEYCKYSACPKLVQIHYENLHLTGLAPKVWKSSTPDEIREWREARRRNYPTLANVTAKRAEQRSKAERGAVLETKQFGKMQAHRKRRQNDDIESWRNERRRNFPGFQTAAPTSEGSHETASTKAACLPNVVDYPDSDNETEPHTSMTLPSTSSEMPAKQQVPAKPQPPKLFKPNAPIRQNGRYRKPTLLEMLLARDIRRERNIVLQCVRHLRRRGLAPSTAERSNRTSDAARRNDAKGCNIDDNGTLISESNDQRSASSIANSS